MGGVSEFFSNFITSLFQFVFRMGKSRKHKRRRASSSSEDSVDPKSLMKRIKQLERDVRSRSCRSPVRNRIGGYVQRRSYSREGSIKSHVSRSDSPSRGCVSRERSSSVFPNSVLDRIHVDSADSREMGEACSLRSPSRVPRSVVNACSVFDEHPSDELIIHNDVDLAEPELPLEIRQVLGNNPDFVGSEAFTLHDYLVAIWKHNLTNGLKKEDFVKLMGSYDIPTNLIELVPPKLNPELGPLLKQQDKGVDGSHVEVQRQIGVGLCALGKGVNLILNDVEKILPLEFKVKLLASLSDSAQILTNVFHRVSVTRRNLLSPLINKNVKDLVDKTPPSEFLFGSDLVEKIKTAKNVESLSKDLKLVKPSGYLATSQRINRGRQSSRRTSVIQPGSFLNTQRPGRLLGETRPSKGQISRSWDSRKDSRWSGRRERRGRRE